MLKYYHPADINQFKFRDKEEIQNILYRDPRYLDDLPQIAQGNVYTIWSDNEPVAICGWTVSVYDNASLFMSASQNLKNRFNKEIMLDFRSVAEQPKALYKRTECVVSENNINKRFIEFLGFHEECKLKNYDFDGSDMYLYVYVRKNDVQR